MHTSIIYLPISTLYYMELTCPIPEDDFSFPQVGYVSFVEGTYINLPFNNCMTTAGQLSQKLDGFLRKWHDSLKSKHDTSDLDWNV